MSSFFIFQGILILILWIVVHLIQFYLRIWPAQYTHTHTHTHTHACACALAYTHNRMHTHTHTNVHVHLHTYINTCMHAHTHPHTCTQPDKNESSASHSTWLGDSVGPWIILEVTAKRKMFSPERNWTTFFHPAASDFTEVSWFMKERVSYINKMYFSTQI